jgi:hypothetical protein
MNGTAIMAPGPTKRTNLTTTLHTFEPSDSYSPVDNLDHPLENVDGKCKLSLCLIRFVQVGVWASWISASANPVDGVFGSSGAVGPRAASAEGPDTDILASQSGRPRPEIHHVGNEREGHVVSFVMRLRELNRAAPWAAATNFRSAPSSLARSGAMPVRTGASGCADRFL